jgi:hypothetical protein
MSISKCKATGYGFFHEAFYIYVHIQSRLTLTIMKQYTIMFAAAKTCVTNTTGPKTELTVLTNLNGKDIY